MIPIVPGVDAPAGRIRHTAGMGMRAKWQENMADMRAGFEKGFDEEPEVALSATAKGVANATAGLARTLLYGFLFSFHGVTLLPWGHSGAIATTIAAAALAAPKLDTSHHRQQLARALAVFALVGVTLHIGTPPTTSMVLVGAFLTTCGFLARCYPWVYAVAALIAIGGVATQIFGFNVFGGQQLVLSGRPFTPGHGGDEALRIAGFMFVVGLMHVGQAETERFKSKAEQAEAAREAAVVDERARIARELHDVVSHHVTAMTLQAEAAAMTGDKHALSSVATAGRDALTELRRMLGVLRHPDDTEPAGALDPQPGLEQLDTLAARTTSGPQVHIERRGDVRQLSAGVELCAYRLVQEALTNATKHGDATRVDVVLGFEPTALTIEIEDNGRPLAAPRVRGGGLGLIGMRERVSLLDGELQSGPRTDANGFRVFARLPIEQ